VINCHGYRRKKQWLILQIILAVGWHSEQLLSRLRFTMGPPSWLPSKSVSQCYNTHIWAVQDTVGIRIPTVINCSIWFNKFTGRFRWKCGRMCITGFVMLDTSDNFQQKVTNLRLETTERLIEQSEHNKKQ
jgi:hypothetical protein